MILHLVVDLVGHQSRRRALLLRVGKAAEALKFNVFHKFRKLGEFLLRLARETRNKRCAQRHARNLLADFLHQRRQALTVAGAVHAL